MGTFNDKMTGLADAFRSKFSLTGGLTIDQMTTTVRNADIGDGGGFDFSAATDFTADQLLEGEKGFNSNGELITGTLTVSDTPVAAAPEYGYFTEDGNFQQITLDADEPQNVGDAIEIAEGSVFLYATGQDEPDYSIVTDATAADIAYGKTVVLNGMLVTGAMPTSSISVTDNVVTITTGKIAEREVTVGTALAAKTYTPGSEPIVIKAGQYLTGDQVIKAVQSSMEFYECASVNSGESYTGNIVVSGIGDPDGVYTPINSLPFTDNAWTMTNDLSTFYMTLWDDCWILWEGYNDDPMIYASSNNTNPSATAQELCSSTWTKGTFTAEVDSSGPSGTPTWSGYKMAWSEGESGWVKTDELVEGLEIKGYTPRIGTIYNSDATIEVKRAFDGSGIPIPQDGLVFYAPMDSNYVDMISRQSAVVEGGTFTTHNGLNCLYLDGSEYVQWGKNNLIPAGDSVAISLVALIAPTSQGGWRCYVEVGPEDSVWAAIAAKDGDIQSWGGSYITANGKWQSIVMSKAVAGTAKAYLNGQQTGSGSYDLTALPDSCVFLGSTSNTMIGYIAFAAVYDRELSADEVLEIHNTLMEGVQQ